jgi:hypothetical protein
MAVVNYFMLAFFVAIINGLFSKAISVCANVQPFLPALEAMPIAWVASIYLFGVSEKLFAPAWF